jgi:DNA-binding NarL/FixJ family response regulator
MKTISVVLAEDHHVVRQGLRALLAAEADLEVVGEASSGLDVGDLVERVKPDVLVVDFVMPGLNAPDIIRRVAGSPRTRALVLSMHANPASSSKPSRAGPPATCSRARRGGAVRAIRAVAEGPGT